MLASLVPRGVVTFETHEDLLEIELFGSEEQSLGNAVEKRRREFLTGRACARRALERLGVPPGPIPNGHRGEPLWPEGVVGSITHCDGYRACAVALGRHVASVGIDAEVHEPLPDGVLDTVASRRERERLPTANRDVRLDRVLFSAKEAVYKAWFPLTGRWLDFLDVDMSLDVSQRSFNARLLVPGPAVAGNQLTEIGGRWSIAGRFVGTAVVIEAEPS